MSFINWVSLKVIVFSSSIYWVLSSLFFWAYISNSGTVRFYLWNPWVELFMPIIPHEPYKSNSLELRSTFEFSSWEVLSQNSAGILQVEKSWNHPLTWYHEPYTSIQGKLRVKLRS